MPLLMRLPTISTRRYKKLSTVMALKMAVLSISVKIVIITSLCPWAVTAGYAPAVGRDMQINGLII